MTGPALPRATKPGRPQNYDFVSGHKIVDAPQRNATQRRKPARVGIEQHLVALARVRHQPERAARAQFHMRHLQPAIDSPDHQTLFAPVELEGLAHLERQWYEGLAHAGRCHAASATLE